MHPTGQPSRQPSRKPTRQPTRQPSRQPTRQPTRRPSAQPTRQPSANPTTAVQTRIIISSQGFVQSITPEEWNSDSKISSVFMRVVGASLHVHESFIEITSISTIDAAVTDPFAGPGPARQRKLAGSSLVLAIDYTASLPIPVSSSATAVLADTSTYLTSGTFADYFYYAMQASPLFRWNFATSYVSAQGGMSLVSPVYTVVITKSPGPTGQPTSNPSNVPSGQPTNTPTRPPVIVLPTPLLTAAQIQILITTGIAFGSAVTILGLAYFLFFKCYILDRRKMAMRSMGKKSTFVLDLPEEVVEEIAVEKRPERILNKKERAKLREMEREKRTVSPQSGTVAPTMTEEGDAEVIGEGGLQAASRSGIWSCFSSKLQASQAVSRKRDSHRIYISPEDDGTLELGVYEEHKDGWSDDAGDREAKIKTKKKKGKGDDKEAWELAALKDSTLVPIADESNAAGGDRWNVHFNLLPPTPAKEVIKIKQINPQQLSRKEKLMQKKAKEMVDKLKAVELAIQMGEEVSWSEVDDGINSIAGGAKALTQEERRKVAREANMAKEAAVRKKKAIESIKVSFKRRQDQALVHLFTPQVSRRHEFPDADTTQSIFDNDMDGRRRDVVLKRLQARAELRQQRMQAGVEDVVLTNSGPPECILPPGFTVSPIAPKLDLQTLYHRRVMVLWDEEKAKGWFLGTVCSSTMRSGFNFGVKYDKIETHSIEVDGIKTAMLSMEGKHAYGKHWVILDHVDGHNVPKMDFPLDATSLDFDDMV